MRTNRSRRRPRGQALVELAIATPILLWLLLGSFDASVLVSDKVIAGYATRQGARLAAELGGIETNPTMTIQQLDANIVQNVLAVATSMNYSVLQEIDIYSPVRADGHFDPARDMYDKFDGQGRAISYGFPINRREQIPPNEVSIGVRLVWVYRPPTGFASLNITLEESTVMKAAPVLV